MSDQLTLADTEGKRLLAILGTVEPFTIQQPSGVMDSHLVSNHWLISSLSWTLHNLWRQASTLIERQVLEEVLTFAHNNTFEMLTAKYLDDSLVFIRCQIDALCNKHSCGGVTIYRQILICGHFCTWSVTLENCRRNKETRHDYHEEDRVLTSSTVK